MSYEDNKKKNPVYITFVILKTGFDFILGLTMTKIAYIIRMHKYGL